MRYKIITERSHLFAPNINICIVVEFCKVYEIEVLHDAINKVIKKHPLLRASLQFDEKGDAFYNIEAEAEAEISSMRISTDTSWTSIVAQEQKKPFVLSRKPLIRFTCLKDEKNMQLIMCVHHILADGLSCVKIVKDIMSFVNNPNQPIKVQAPNLLEGLTLYNKESLSMPVMILVSILNRLWQKTPYKFSETEYYPMRQSYWAQRSHIMKAAELNEKQMSQLITKCKENKITVNTFLLTTLLEAAQKFDPKNTKIGIAASIRSEEMGIGNFASAFSIQYKYNARETIWENALKVQKLVDKKLGNNKRKLFFLTFLKALDRNLIDSIHFSLWGNFKNRATEMLKKILGYNEIPTGLGLTNLGKVNLSTLDGIKSVYFIPPLIDNTDKIIGTITTEAGFSAVCQYSKQINTETNKSIIDEWLIKLKVLSDFIE